MVNLSQKIGIFCRDMNWGRDCFEHIISQIPIEYIKSKKISKNECRCELYNGDIIRTIKASENVRGYKFSAAIVQDGIDRRIINDVIYPCVIYPLAVVRSMDEIVVNYASIKQELPRNKNVRKFRVTIKA